MTLSLISIGLSSHKDLTLRSVEAARRAHKIYAETYTMKLETTLNQISKTIGKPVIPLLRGDMEENAPQLLEEAKTIDIAILVGGDALSATTHISLLIEAQKQGIPAQVIHGASILTAIAEAGLSLYKFGRTVTVPLPEKGPVDTVIRIIRENKEHGLHTLILLDLNIPENKYLTIPEALIRLINSDEYLPETLTVGVARLGSRSQRIKADTAANLITYEWGDPPHSLVVPGSLHFLEEDALKTLAECPPSLLEDRLVTSELERLIDKYSKGCSEVLETIELNPLPAHVTEQQVKKLIDHTERYISDAQYYRGENNPIALTSVAYAEGILDALKLLGLAEFQW